MLCHVLTSIWYDLLDLDFIADEFLVYGRRFLKQLLEIKRSWMN